MPANMMIAVTGGRLNVKGSKRATVPVDPIPGRTPMNVPIKQPKKQKNRLLGVRMTENPKPILWKTSMKTSLRIYQTSATVT